MFPDKRDHQMKRVLTCLYCLEGCLLLLALMATL
jgi:hypothetical protein